MRKFVMVVILIVAVVVGFLLFRKCSGNAGNEAVVTPDGFVFTDPPEANLPPEFFEDPSPSPTAPTTQQFSGIIGCQNLGPGYEWIVYPNGAVFITNFLPLRGDTLVVCMSPVPGFKILTNLHGRLGELIECVPDETFWQPGAAPPPPWDGFSFNFEACQ